MDLGGLNWFMVTVVGAGILGLVILFGVLKTKSEGKNSSPAETERATDALYNAEDKAHRDEDV